MGEPYAVCTGSGWYLVGPRKANFYDVDQQIHEWKVDYVLDLNHLPSQQI